MTRPSPSYVTISAVPAALIVATLAGLVSGALVLGRRRPNAPPAASLSQTTGADAPDGATAARLSERYGQLPLRFEANVGQTDAPEVNFISRGVGYQLFLTPTEAVLALQKGAGGTGRRAANSAADRPSSPAPQPSSASILRMKIVGADRAAASEGRDQLPGRSHYLTGNDPAKWRTGVPHYARVEYREVYPGVDLVYYGKQQQLEYDFVLAPGADPGRIMLAFEGARRMRLDEQGDLVLETEGGELRQHRPIAYQEVGGERREVAGRYAVRGARAVGFELGEYDTTLPLTIDPVLSYSTYLGGANNNNEGRAIAVDAEGYAYVTGFTGSTTFPATAGAYRTTLNNASADIFVTKLNKTGDALVYSTYLGGAKADEVQGIAVDSGGNAYVTGHTQSLDYPLMNAFQTAHAGATLNDRDAFITKLNASGSALVYSTYLGGAAGDRALAIALDSTNSAYVTGATSSADFPLMNPYQAVKASHLTDMFVTKLSPAGDALIYSTFFGGANGGNEGHAVAVDAGGNAVVAGVTSSSFFPHINAWRQYSSSLNHAFVMKFNDTGTAVIYSTGISDRNHASFGRAVAVDSEGNAYVTGDTDPVNFPTMNPLPGSCDGFTARAFVTKIGPAGGPALYSTCLGGTGARDEGHGIAVDEEGSAYVTGFANTTNFPVRRPFQASRGAGTEAFVTKLLPSGNVIGYSSYLGGGGEDRARAVALDAAGNAYVTGITSSTNFLTVNPYQPSKRSGSLYHAFASKVPPGADLAIAMTHTGPFRVGIDGDFRLTVTNTRPEAAAGKITVTDELPAGLSFISGAGAGWSCSASGQLVTCTSEGPLEAGASADLLLTVGVGNAAIPGVTNTARVEHADDTNPLNDEATDAAQVLMDATPPVITPKVDGTPGENGWFVSDMTVSWEVSDAESGITSTSGCDTLTVTADTEISITCEATSGGGSRAVTIPVRRDVTPPVTSLDHSVPAAPNENGWFKEHVILVYHASDNLSGLAGVPPLFAHSILSEGADQKLTFAVKDQAGNTSEVVSPSYNIDRTPPTLASGSRTPSPNAFGWNNTDVTVGYSFTDALSGFGDAAVSYGTTGGDTGTSAAAGAYTLTQEGEGQEVTLTATDKAGNQATFSVSDINIDKTAPEIIELKYDSATPPSSYGWYRTNVTAALIYDFTADLSGISPESHTIHPFTAEGADQEQTLTLVDRAGNVATRAAQVSIDKTAPVISVARAPEANAAGWNNTDVTASYTASDGLSGLTEASPATGSHVFATQGMLQSRTFTVTDRADNAASAVVNNVNIDKTPPAVSCGSPDGLWHANNLMILCTASDGLAGLAGLGDTAFTLSTSVPEGVETADAVTDSRAVSDLAGNTATAGPVGGIRVDRKAPAVTVFAPAAGAYLLNQSVPANYLCADGGSGVGSCAGTIAAGAPLDTSSVGTKPFVISATDAVGNASGLSLNYAVTYKIVALYDEEKAHKSGKTIQFKIQLADANNVNASSAGVTVTALGTALLSTFAPGPVEEGGADDPDDNFKFAPDLTGTSGYMYKMKATGLTTGTYVLIFTAAGDPLTHGTKFQIK